MARLFVVLSLSLMFYLNMASPKTPEPKSRSSRKVSISDVMLSPLHIPLEDTPPLSSPLGSSSMEAVWSLAQETQQELSSPETPYVYGGFLSTPSQPSQPDMQPEQLQFPPTPCKKAKRPLEDQDALQAYSSSSSSSSSALPAPPQAHEPEHTGTKEGCRFDFAKIPRMGSEVKDCKESKKVLLLAALFGNKAKGPHSEENPDNSFEVDHL